jgi:hypothetical protein
MCFSGNVLKEGFCYFPWEGNGTAGRLVGWAGSGDEGVAAATPGARSFQF